MQNTVKQYKAILAKRNALSHAMGVLSYDSETAMPKTARRTWRRLWQY